MVRRFDTRVGILKNGEIFQKLVLWELLKNNILIMYVECEIAKQIVDNFLDELGYNVDPQ